MKGKRIKKVKEGKKIRQAETVLVGWRGVLQMYVGV